MMKSEAETKHIVMLPLMAQGHIRPFMELAHRLVARTQFTITIITTPLNAQSLRQQLLSTAIRIAELPFNSSDHGLPPNIENTDKLPLSQIFTFYHASTSLEPHFRNFLSLHFPNPPICIIFDIFFGWANTVARDVGSTGITLTTCSAYGSAFNFATWNELPHLNLSDDEDFHMLGFPETYRFRRSHLHPALKNADGLDFKSRFLQPQIRFSLGSSGWLCNSVEQVERIGLQALRNYVKLPVWAVGPLIPSPTEKSSSSSSSDDDEEDEEFCVKWMNTQKPDSVLYISFGSQNTISPTQMMELAAGLELSRKPFLWVIRPPMGFDINGEFKPEWLPEGFEERMREKKQGILVHKWGPQVKILSHKSTGAFLSHCGWNSVLEALREGVPIIGWPLVSEQPANLKMMVEELGVAMELARGVEMEISKEEVKKVLGLVMDRGERSFGLKMKMAAIQVGNELRDATKEEAEYKGSSIKAMDDFVDAILSPTTNI